MSSLGVYFGPGMISLVETKGKKVLNSARIPCAAFIAGDLEDKVPYEVKVVTLLKDAINKHKIEAKEATIALSGKDLIIRNFDLPLLPHNELPGAINFEARKYIPFKIEDLISGYQLQLDRLNRRNLALFIGIKKETLDKYISILGQSGIKVNAVEYSAFSNLRLLKLTGISDKGIVGLISMDLQEEDEVNFTVLEGGFPLFSRDITLIGSPAEFGKTKEIDSAKILEKLKNEMRISMDYYRRKFPTKEIKKVFLISSEDYRSDLEAFIKETGPLAQSIDPVKYNKYIGKAEPFSLSLVKGYSSSLSKTVKTRLKIDLLAVKPVAAATPKEAAAIAAEFAPLLTNLSIKPAIVVLGLLIYIATFALGIYRKQPFQNKINSIIKMRPKVSVASPASSYDELVRIDKEYKSKIEVLDRLIKEQPYLTLPLNVIPRVIPKEMWLDNFSYRKEEDNIQLTLEGAAYLGNSNKEFELINSFLSELKKDQVFNRYFAEIKVTSLDSRAMDKITVTRFVISCVSSRRRRR